MKLLMAILAILSLTACTTPAERAAQAARIEAQQRQIEEKRVAEQEYHHILKECLKEPFNRKSALKEEECYDNEMDIYADAMQDPHRYIIHEQSAAKHRATLYYVAGKVTKDELTQMLKGIHAEHKNEMDEMDAQQRRDVQQAQLAAQQQAIMEQQHEDMKTLQLLQIYQGMQPQYIPTPQTNIQCMRGVPGMVNCSTY